jgi:TonB-linked SusC/RagA family outer membrane protein
MKNFRKTIFLLLALFSCVNVFSQRAIIRGRIIDKETKDPVIGANVIEYDKESRIINGTITDVNGDFVLEMKDKSHIIKISVIGYETKQIDVNTAGPMTIELASSNLEIEEVTVTATSKSNVSLTNIADRDIASSTVKVDLSEMTDVGVLSASDALQGKVSGLDIISASGDPGSGSQLVIRGLSSMGNNKPLIVIDGIPQSRVSDNFDLSSADSEDISNLVNIALQDIKSIEILKDAASTAVYGSQGADGVLLIETHKGKLGKVKFDYQYKNSINFQPPAIPLLNGNEYIMLQLEEWHNSKGVFDIPPEIAYDRDYYDFYNYSANTDWLGAITQNSVTNDHYFNISGGGQKTRYFTSFSYIDEGGTTINTDSKRFSTRVNLDYFLSRNLVFSIQFNYTNNRTAGNLKIGDNNVRQMAYIKAPNMSIWEHDAYGNLTGEYFTPINSYQGDGSTYFNPVAVATLGKNDKNANNLQNTFRLRYNIFDWLIFRETVSVQYEGSKQSNFLPYNAIGADWLAWNINMAEEGNNINQSLRTETQLAFDIPFKNKDQVLSGAVNWITDQNSYEWMNIQSNKTPSTDIQDPAIDAQINYIGNGSGEARSLGALINLNYKYKDRYMIQTNFRADAHSSFGSNNRWGLFKGISGGWRFSSEPWLSNLRWLGESMLRVSWGVTGRQPGDAYARFATFATTSNGNYMSYPAIIPTQIQLNNLRWESVASTDLGLELNMFKDKVYIEADLYNKLTSDILFKDYDIPKSSGFDQLKFLNGGSLENRGWELMLDYKILRRDKMVWSIYFNTSQNINSFTSLPDNFNTEQSTSIGNGDYPKRVIDGEPIGSFFGFRYLGVYPSDADAIARDANGNILRDSQGNPIPMTYLDSYTFQGGDAKYQDVNHDGKIDLGDVVYIGDSNPDYIGGFGTNFRYKDFDIGFGFHYRMGFDIINGVAIETEGMNNRNNQSKVVLARWRVQGQDEPGMIPRAYLNHPANNLGSDRYVEPGDFIRLNNIKVGYRFPDRLCQKMHLRTLNFTLSARKLMTLTRYTGQDPEVGQDASDPFWIGVDKANTPPPKIVTISIAIGF